MTTVEELEAWASDTNEAIHLQLGTGSIFHPTFSYPFFGQSELVYGFKGLIINIKFTPATLFHYFHVDYTEKLPHVQPNDLYKVFTEDQRLIESNGTLDSLVFQKQLLNNQFVPPGKKIHEYQWNDECYEYYQCNHDMPKFKEYNRKLRLFLLFYIEGASFIEEDDLNWNCLLIFRKQSDTSPCSIVGFVTYYPFYYYPDKIRMRISQFLILPPFQQQGHGGRLYQFLYQMLVDMKNVVEITVEDPNDDFQDMRDLYDVRMLLRAKAFNDWEPPIDLVKLEQVRQKYKLSKRQMRRCAEILFLHKAETSHESKLVAFRQQLKRRIYWQNQEALSEMEKDDRFIKLEQTFQAIRTDYYEVLDKLSDI